MSIVEMFAGAGHKLGRAAVACTVAATMTVAGPARAGEPGEAAAGGPPTEELNSQAEKHAIKAVEHFNNGAYVDAEEEFRRLAFFAPNWRPLHYNLGVLAEAQGKLATAVQEYKTFRPYGSPEEQLIVDQRIDELGRRKQRIAGAYKRQIALGAGAVTLGAGGLVGGGVLIYFSITGKDDVTALKSAATDASMLGNSATDQAVKDMYYSQADAYTARAGELEKRNSRFMIGGGVLALYGLLALVYAVVPLRNSIRSKRQLDGLALGPTRLKWNGGAGVQLRF